MTVTVFGNLYEEKNTTALHGEASVLLSVLPTLRHISVRKQRLFLTLTHQVFVMKINHHDGQPSRPRRQ